MIQKNTTIPLSGLKDGAVDEVYQAALAKVLENIYDPNTKAALKRKLVVTMVLKPSKDRSTAEVDIEVKTQLAPPLPIETVLVLAHEDGAVVGREPKQAALFHDPTSN